MLSASASLDAIGRWAGPLLTSLRKANAHEAGLASPPVPPQPHPRLYAGLGKEDKARLAVAAAITLNSAQFTERYTPSRVIGFGNNGACLLCHDSTTGLQVAIKVIYRAQSAEPPYPACPEIDTLTAVQGASPYIIAYKASWQDRNHIYLVTEPWGDPTAPEPADADPAPPPLRISDTLHLPVSTGSSDLFAWSYAARLHEYSTHAGSLHLPHSPLKRIIAQVAHALRGINTRGYVHGDVKLENILIRYPAHDATEPEARLVDFGHARPLRGGAGGRYGTRIVAAPEFLSDSPFDEGARDARAADVFALGMVLYLLLNGDGGMPEVCNEMQRDAVGFFDLVSVDKGRFPFEGGVLGTARDGGDGYDNRSSVDGDTGVEGSSSGLEGIEGDALDLLHAMCMVNPVRRLTIDQVLEHPWLAEVQL
ncbi:kinase-like domain-containing protein [Chytriomyces sp. MP71]|nr:kinase-like domain-containing protein [Chytriomyces sp. MP71]